MPEMEEHIVAARGEEGTGGEASEGVSEAGRVTAATRRWPRNGSCVCAHALLADISVSCIRDPVH
jgi:hypothetical protein